MNKTILIAGGASVASLAVGGALGYLLAQKAFATSVSGIIADEVHKTREFYKKELAEVRRQYTELLTKVNYNEAIRGVKLLDEEFSQDDAVDNTPIPAKVVRPVIPGTPVVDSDAERAFREKNAKVAIVNYQGFSEKPPLSEYIAQNIFTAGATSTPAPQPRDPSTGRFEPKTKAKEPTLAEAQQEPILIEMEEYLSNIFEWDQDSLQYFPAAKTLIKGEDEVIDIELVGEDNLYTLVNLDVPEDEVPTIYVRNEMLQVEFDVRVSNRDIGEQLGMGPGELEDIPDDPYDDADAPPWS